MATVLVDYENVINHYGLAGAEYLTENDDLCIFYSETCANIRKIDSKLIEDSGCSFRMCELRKQRANALDFYIAAEAGIAYKSGAKEIILVTRDTGFHSIRDYFLVKNIPARLIVEPTIEKGLLRLRGVGEIERNQSLFDENERISLPGEISRINERKKIKEALMEYFSGTEYEDEIPRIMNCIKKTGTSSKRDLYRTSLHEFGISRGTTIYNLLKQVV